MKNHNNLINAMKVKNDEFYTSLYDIENEIHHYKKYFENRIVYCNCDDIYASNFAKFFIIQFNHLKLKKLYITGISLTNHEPMLYEVNHTNDTICITDRINNMIDIQSTPIESGRFQDNINILEKCDIVVTNPPFSLFREYVQLLNDYNKKFIIIGNKNAITCKNIFPYIMKNQLFLGITRPSNFEQYTEKKKNMQGLTRWFTNIDINKHTYPLELYKTYNKEEYPKYDNYDAINVDKVKDIPCDYYGVMGVPITFLDNYNSEQFEIIDLAKRGCDFKNLRTKIYTKEITNYSSLNATPVIVVNGKLECKYSRLLIKRKNI